MNAQTQIVAGSMGAIAQQIGKSLAETFLSAEVIIIVDTSGSMNTMDSRGGKSRYDVACEELAQLQAHKPGKIAVISFSNQVIFCPSGVPTYFGGGTDMAKALQFAKVADVPGMQFILISDGQPDDPERTLTIARSYKNKISVIYVGPEDQSLGRDFLDKLAKTTGGQSIAVECAKNLKSGIETLLLPK